MKITSKIFILFVLILSSVLLFASNKGQLRGQIIDEATKDPISNAKVTIVELELDIAADADGLYFFSGLDIGIYSIRVEMVGYETFVRQNVIVTAGVTTTETPIQLKRGVASKTTIEVQSTRKLIRRDVTDTSRSVEEKELRDAPVSSFQAMVSTVPGVVALGGQLHVRGGRADEVNYMVDGMTIKDPVTGTFGGNVNKNAIKEIVVKTGGFSAEFGGALSAIVNVVTKEGERYYSGSFSYYTSKAFLIKAADQGDLDINWEIGGPIPVFKRTSQFPFLSFYLSGSSYFGDYKWQSNPRHNPNVDYDTDWPGANFNEVSSKLTMRISPRMKLVAGYQYAWAWINVLSQPGYRSRRDEHQPTQHQRNQQINFEFNQTVTNNLFYQVFLYSFQNGILYTVNNKEPDEYEWDYETDRRDYPVYQNRTSKQHTLKMDVVNQVSRIHRIKAGFAYSYFELSSVFRVYPGQDYETKDDSIRYLDDQVFYIQDEMDWDQDLVMNIGMRFDRRQFAGSSFSPRIGVSFAITDRVKFRFNWGIFYQPPPTMFVIEEKYDDPLNQSNNQFLQSENAIQYEYGIDYLFSDVLKFDVTVYYKNTSDLIKYVSGSSRLGGFGRDMPMNVDHAYSQGLEISLIKTFANNYFWRFSYALSDAKGTSSNPYIPISVLTPKEYPLNWDITHNANLQVNYDGQEFGFALIAYWNSGRPYTSVDGSKRGIVNDARYPHYKKIDISMWKNFPHIRWFGLRYRAFAEVRNIFNTNNITAVWADGSARLYDVPVRAKAGIDISF